jgi:nucleotide-binding universal stress UspA family protein
MKSILCLFDGNDDEITALATAMRLAKGVRGTLDVVHVTYLSDLATGRAASLAGGFMDVIDRHRERIREGARALFEAVAARHEISTGDGNAASFVAITNASNANLVRRLTLADMVVVGAGRHSSDVIDRLPVDLALFAARRPVLVVRPEAEDAAAGILGARTVVAWDGSLAATRALVAARPILAGQQSVTLLTAAPATADPAPALHYLAAHGIGARHERVEGDAPVHSILGRAREIGAGLVVTGAYGHSVIREKIFGGFTDRIVTDADLPLLLAN